MEEKVDKRAILLKKAIEGGEERGSKHKREQQT